MPAVPTLFQPSGASSWPSTAWVQKYQAKYGTAPDALCTLAYDAANLLIEAIARAGSVDSTRVRDAMAGTNRKSEDGLAGGTA